MGLAVAELLLLPDAEQLLWAWLRDQPEVTTLVAAERIISVVPDKFSFGAPFVRYQRVGGLPTIRQPLVADQARIQIDCYSGTKSQTKQLAETIRACADTRLVGSHALGTVSRVEYGSLAFAPDESLATVNGGSRPRYTFDLRITVKIPANPPV